MVKFYVQGHQESQCPSVPTVCPECGRKAIPRAQVSFFATHKNNCKGTKTVLDSRFQAADFGFQVLDSRQCQWSLDSEFQVLVAFRIQQANFSRFRDQKIPRFWNRDFRTWSYMGQSSMRLRSQSMCMYTYRWHLILSYLYRQSLDFECNLEFKKKHEYNFQRPEKCTSRTPSALCGL